MNKWRLPISLFLVLAPACVPFLDTSPIEAVEVGLDASSDPSDDAESDVVTDTESDVDVAIDSDTDTDADSGVPDVDTGPELDVGPTAQDPCGAESTWCDELGALVIRCDVVPTIENCTFGCVDGACQDTCTTRVGCSADALSVLECVGTSPEIDQTCPEGFACVDGGCRGTSDCEPGGSRCNPAGDLALCDETGAEEVIVPCPGATCVEVWRDVDEDGWGDGSAGVSHACAMTETMADNPYDCDDTIPTASNSPCPGLAIVRGGTFLMGTPSGETEPVSPIEVNQQMVEITRGLLVMETEVTQELWVERSGTVTNPAFHTDCPTCPVERVNWFEALTFANAMSESEGLPRCYELSECSGAFAGGCPDGDQFCAGLACDSVVFAGFDCLGYRLPSEAEWEFFTRSGSTGPFGGRVEELAWFRGTVETSESQPVGGMLPNAWGLYDVHGNVAEWVMDIVDGPYPESDGTLPDPLSFGTADDVSSLTARGVRGGGFVSVESAIRAAARGQTLPQDRVFSVGMRLVRTFDSELGDR